MKREVEDPVVAYYQSCVPNHLVRGGKGPQSADFFTNLFDPFIN
jgi:hypothetical protein